VNNTSKLIAVTDFNLDETASLNQRYSTPLSSVDLEHLHNIVSGHPLMLHYAFDAIRAGIPYKKVIETALAPDSCFAPHLKERFEAAARTSLIPALKQIASGQPCMEELYLSLRDLGLACNLGQGKILRCPLYQKFLQHYYT
jgi:hypothetical protein